MTSELKCPGPFQGEQKIRLDDIKIYPCFQETPPGEQKIELKEQYLTKTGLFKSDIILDGDNYLIDGYTSYLLAKEHGMEYVPFRYGKRQIVRASHRSGGKLYTWELPKKLIDRVHAGDRVVVPCNNCFIVVPVAAVEDCTSHEYMDHFRMVIKAIRSNGKDWHDKDKSII